MCIHWTQENYLEPDYIPQVSDKCPATDVGIFATPIPLSLMGFKDPDAHAARAEGELADDRLKQGASNALGRAETIRRRSDAAFSAVE